MMSINVAGKSSYIALEEANTNVHQP